MRMAISDQCVNFQTEIFSLELLLGLGKKLADLHYDLRGPFSALQLEGIPSQILLPPTFIFTDIIPSLTLL